MWCNLRRKKGFVLITTIVFLFIIASIIASFLIYSSHLKRKIVKSYPEMRGNDVVIGMINRAIWELVRTNGSWTGVEGTLPTITGDNTLPQEIFVDIDVNLIKDTPAVDTYRVEVSLKDNQFQVVKKGVAIVNLYTETIPFPILAAPSVTGRGRPTIGPIPWANPTSTTQPIPLLALEVDNAGSQISLNRGTLGPGISLQANSISLRNVTFLTDPNYPPNQISADIINVTANSGYQETPYTPVSLETLREALEPILSRIPTDDNDNTLNLPTGSPQPAPQEIVNLISSVLPNGNLNVITLNPDTYYDEIELEGRTVVVITQPGEYYIGELEFEGEEGRGTPQGRYIPIILLAPQGQDPSAYFGNALEGSGVRIYIGKLEDKRGPLVAGNTVINPTSDVVQNLTDSNGNRVLSSIANSDLVNRLPSSPSSLLLAIGKYEDEGRGNAPDAAGRSIISGYLIINELDDSRSFSFRGRTTLIGGLILLDPDASVDLRGRPTLYFDPNGAQLVTQKSYLQNVSIVALSSQ